MITEGSFRQDGRPIDIGLLNHNKISAVAAFVTSHGALLRCRPITVKKIPLKLPLIKVRSQDLALPKHCHWQKQKAIYFGVNRSRD